MDLELKKLYANAITGDATEAAQMEIDSEEAADMVQLQELVNKQTRKATAALEKEVASLRAMIQSSSKNDTRGRTPLRGALKKKKSKKSENTKKPSNGRKDGASANASPNAKGKKKTRNSGKKNTGKKVRFKTAQRSS